MLIGFVFGFLSQRKRLIYLPAYIRGAGKLLRFYRTYLDVTDISRIIMPSYSAGCAGQLIYRVTKYIFSAEEYIT
jgi:hypothetical protein